MDDDRWRHEAVHLALQVLKMQAQRPEEPTPSVEQLLNYAGKIQRFIEGAK